MKIITMTEEQIDEEYAELSKALSDIYDKDIVGNTGGCGKTLGLDGKGEAIQASFYNSLQGNQSEETVLNPSSCQK